MLVLICRPEAINQLGFIGEKILSRKHKEFMTQINEVTNSLQDSVSSNYRDENISYDGTGREPVKATETAVDLLQSFAISSPSTVKKVLPTKSVKVTKPVHNQDGSTLVTKEDPSVLLNSKEVPSKEVDHDDSELKKPLKHYHKVIVSSSDESEVDYNTELLQPVAMDTASNVYNDNSFNTVLHDQLYPCHNEQFEVKWSSRTATVTNVVTAMKEYKHYSCFIHPAAPWQRCKPLCRQSGTDTSHDGQTLKDKQQETTSNDEGAVPDEESIARHSARLGKRRTESEHLSSDSDTESLKINLAANEQAIVNPTGTRTSKRVRRAPIKLRQ